MTEQEQEKDALWDMLTEDFVEPSANFYVPPTNREKYFDLWRQFKKTLAGYKSPEEIMKMPKDYEDTIKEAPQDRYCYVCGARATIYKYQHSFCFEHCANYYRKAIGGK